MRSRAVLGGLALLLAACAGDGEVAASTDAPPAGSTSEAAADVPPELRAVSRNWQTDFTVASIDLAELKVGIPTRDPRDAIPPIDEPAFETVTSAGGWLEDPEPGVVVQVDDVVRYYPLRIMTRHEIVNDRFGDRAVVVTYCPLCNTALAFDPEVDGTVLRFGVSGLLRQSDLVMWDDATESLWQQVTGEAIVGTLTGSTLETVPSRILRWADFRTEFPDGEVLGLDQGFGTTYGANPYVGYSSRPAPIGGFFDGEVDDRYPALERVVGVSIPEGDKAYPFPELTAVGAVNDEIGGVAVVVMWGAPDTADALDGEQIAQSRGIGTGVAYHATVDGSRLTFEPTGQDRFVDAETGTTWNLLGHAVEGPLSGTRLEVATHRNEFWFVWQSFFPDAPVWTAP
jgi:hypothetical protein